MFNAKNFPMAFDILVGGGEKGIFPVDQKIRVIESRLGAKLPSSFISFCKGSRYYGNWFCDLTDDYTNWQSILKVNSFFKKIRRRHSPKSIYQNVRRSPKRQWAHIKPDNFILIRRDHDDHCLVFDTSKDSGGGEFGLIYWDPGYDPEFRDSYINFEAYMQSFLQYCFDNADKYIQEKCKMHIMDQSD